MIELFLFVILGSMFLLFLILFWRRDYSRPEFGAQAMIDARDALQTLQSGLLPLDSIRRLFQRVDYQYVLSSASTAIQGEFVKERKQLALAWVSQVQNQVVSLRRFHLGHSRYYSQLSLRSELSLAIDFSVLLFECRTLKLLISLRGPYAYPRLVGRAVTSTARVCGLTEKSLDFLKLAPAVPRPVAVPPHNRIVL